MNGIRSISLASRVVMDTHALNNEGSISNRLMTREVGIVVTDAEAKYRRDTVNAISGDMNKHIFADAYRHIALDMGIHLCEACSALDPARMMGNEDFRDWLGEQAAEYKTTPGAASAKIVDELLTCGLDDVAGIMITAGGMSIKRKSAVEFGWTLGLPDYTEVQEFVHARHAINRVSRTSAEEDKEKARAEKEENIGQMVFDRPASSGVYAFVAHVDVSAIGFNDYSQEYPVSAAERDLRLRATLLALAQTLLHPKGALTSTQLPHVLDAEGYISVSSSAVAAPLISPLKDNYRDMAQNVSGHLNQLHGDDATTVLLFDGADGLLGQMGQVADRSAGTYRG